MYFFTVLTDTSWVYIEPSMYWFIIGAKVQNKSAPYKHLNWSKLSEIHMREVNPFYKLIKGKMFNVNGATDFFVTVFLLSMHSIPM